MAVLRWDESWMRGVIPQCDIYWLSSVEVQLDITEHQSCFDVQQRHLPFSFLLHKGKNNLSGNNILMTLYVVSPYFLPNRLFPITLSSWKPHGTSQQYNNNWISGKSIFGIAENQNSYVPEGLLQYLVHVVRYWRAPFVPPCFSHLLRVLYLNHCALYS